MKQLFVTGISTEVGKTVVSSILTEYLQADYWKPIQSGDLHLSDTMKVQSLVSNSKTVFHPERYRLQSPLSPHASAEIDGIQISLNDFELPQTENNLIVEGAGGLFVPLNEKDTVIDLIERLKLPVVLVSRNYLGSINHTMLSIEAL
jgi:dethiobiotin synthetase